MRHPNKYIKLYDPNTYPTLSYERPSDTSSFAMKPWKNVMLKVPTKQVNKANIACLFESKVHQVIVFFFSNDLIETMSSCLCLISERTSEETVLFNTLGIRYAHEIKAKKSSPAKKYIVSS